MSKQLLSICWFILFFHIHNIQSQTNLDSLWQIWTDDSQNDTTRLYGLNRMIWADNFKLFKENSDSVFALAQLGFDYSDSIENKFWIAKMQFTQGTLFQKNKDFDKSIECFKNGSKYFEEMGNKKTLSLYLNKLRQVYYAKADYFNGLDYAKKYLAVAIELKDSVKICVGYFETGKGYRYQGDYGKSLENLNQSLKLEEALGDTLGMASKLNDIGLVFVTIGDTLQALDYYNQSLKYKKKSGSPMSIATTLNNVANIYTETGDYEKALEIHFESLKIREEFGDKIDLAMAHGNIGRVYNLKGEFEKSLQYQKSSLALEEEAGNLRGMPFSLKEIGQIYAKQGFHNKALTYFNKALDLSLEMRLPYRIEYSSLNAYKSYKALGNDKKALNMYELYIETRDSIKSKSQIRAVLKQESQYNYEKQSLADSLAQVEKDLRIQMLHDAEVRQQSSARNIAFVIGAMILLLAGALWNRLNFIRNANIEIAKQKERAEQSEKYKEQFLANMSHEIRTPMHAISGMTNILKRKNHLPEQSIYLDAIEKSSSNLIVILNDVLDISKIESGKIRIEPAPMHPKQVLDLTIDTLRFKAQNQGLSFSYKIDRNVPEQIISDGSRLNQVLINLAGNAIKFTEKGFVKINLRKIQKEAKELIQFEIKDSGIGIPADKLDTIFDSFEQLDQSLTKKYAGTGLGLHISKQLIELQGGNIWVESQEGEGSTFFFTLPLIPVQEEVKNAMQISEAEIVELGKKMSGLKILLAEDNEFNVMVAQDDLSYYIPDVKIDHAENGKEAVELFKEENYDLILMDMQMPEMNGYDGSKVIRLIEKNNNVITKIPIIAMTASLLKSEIDSCYEAGMNNHIPKPYSIEELVGTIYEEMQKSQALVK